MSNLLFQKKIQCRFCGNLVNHRITCVVSDKIYDMKGPFMENEKIWDEHFPTNEHVLVGDLENFCPDNHCQSLEKKYSKYNHNAKALFANKKFIGIISPVLSVAL